MAAPEFRPETLPQSVRAATEMQAETLIAPLEVPNLLKERLGIDEKITVNGLGREFRHLIPDGKELIKVAIVKDGQTFNQELAHTLYGANLGFSFLSDQEKYFVLTLEKILDQNLVNISKVEPGDSFSIDFNTGTLRVVSSEGVEKSPPIELSVDLFREAIGAIEEKSFSQRQALITEMQGNTLGKVFQQLFNKMGTPTERLQLLKDVPTLVEAINADLKATGHAKEALDVKNLNTTYKKTAVQNEAYKRALLQMMEQSYGNQDAVTSASEAEAPLRHESSSEKSETGQDAYNLIANQDALYQVAMKMGDTEDAVLQLQTGLKWIDGIQDPTVLRDVLNKGLLQGTGVVRESNKWEAWSPAFTEALKSRIRALESSEPKGNAAQTPSTSSERGQPDRTEKRRPTFNRPFTKNQKAVEVTPLPTPAELPAVNSSSAPESLKTTDVSTLYATLSNIDAYLKTGLDEPKPLLDQARTIISGLSDVELTALLNRALSAGHDAVSNPYESFTPQIAGLLKKRSAQLSGSDSVMASND